MLVARYFHSELCRINEDQKVALDLDPYVKKLLNARRRVVLVNNILQNAQVKEVPTNSESLLCFLSFQDTAPIFKGCLKVSNTMKDIIFPFFKRLYLFLETGEERVREKEGEEKHQCAVASLMPPAGDLALNPGMCPDWESNRQLFDSHAGVQSTEPHQLGQKL